MPTDQFFKDYQFVALGAPDPAGRRTLPARLSDVINVKDWGALGTGSDYTTVIQQAINYAMSLGGGTVFFPPGNYQVHNLAIGNNTADAGIIITGSGLGTNIFGLDSTGAIFSGGGLTYDCLEELSNMNHSGGGATVVKVTRANARVRGLSLSGYPVSIDASGYPNAFGQSGAFISDCSIRGPNQPAPYQIPHFASGSAGVVLSSQCVAQDVRVQTGYEVAFALSGSCAGVFACSTENNVVGVRFGWGLVGGTLQEVQAVACSAFNVQTERTNTQFEFYNAVGCVIGGCTTAAFDGTPRHELLALLTQILWSTGTPPLVTCTTSPAHGIANGVYRLQVLPVASGFAVSGLPAGWVLATVINPTQFTYQLPGSTAPTTNPTTGEWNWPMQYSFRARKANQCTVFASNLVGANNSIATVDLDYGGDINAVQQSNVIVGQYGGQGWILPRGVNRAAWQFIECSGNINPFDVTYAPGSGNPGGVQTVSNPMGQTTSMHFADLPGGSNNQPGPFEGQEYSIVDSSLPAALNFAAAPVGGGTNHVKVRYVAGSINNWLICG